MHEVAKRSAVFAAATGSVLLVGAAVASADAMAHATPAEGVSARAAALPASGVGGPSILSGNSVQIPVTVPANLCGVNVLGTSADGATCASGTPATVSSAGASSAGPSIASGNSVQIPVTVPANVCGVNVLGTSADSATCTTGTPTTAGATGAGASSAGPSIASGNSVQIPVTVPANVCGVNVLGTSADSATCTTGTPATTSGAGSADATVTGPSIASAHTAQIPVTVPANVCGIDILGTSADSATCTTGTPATTSGAGSAAPSSSGVSGDAVRAIASEVPPAVSAAANPASAGVPTAVRALSTPISVLAAPGKAADTPAFQAESASAVWQPRPAADPATAHAGSGRLAQTGVEGLMAMGLTGATALTSGAGLAAFATKGKSDTSCL